MIGWVWRMFARRKRQEEEGAAMADRVRELERQATQVAGRADRQLSEELVSAYRAIIGERRTNRMARYPDRRQHP